jgi:hypothetical protein
MKGSGVVAWCETTKTMDFSRLWPGRWSVEEEEAAVVCEWTVSTLRTPCFQLTLLLMRGKGHRLHATWAVAIGRTPITALLQKSFGCVRRLE